MYTVYVHINRVNGKRYVGITSTSVERRWKNGYGYSRDLPIGRAIEKYGWDSFEHVILFTDKSEQEAKEIEKSLIHKWNTQNDLYGYNICAGGDGVTGWHPSESTKEKISLAASKRYGELNPNYGHHWSDEMKKKHGEKKRRENLSKETLDRMSAAAQKRIGDKNPFYGHKHTEETRNRISQCRSRPVKKFDKNGLFLKEYASIKCAAEDTGINKVAISNCCRKLGSSGGYLWRYSDKCDL